MTDRVRVWDGFVRLFHWSLVGLIAGTWLTAEGPKLWHERMGYVIAALILARLVWGLVGPRHARFGDFVRGPGTVVAYLRALRAGCEPRYLGHNPAGGAMIVALLLAVSGTVLTGWLQTTDAFWGSSTMGDVHEALATLILVLAGIHVLGVMVESLRHRENLVWSMLTGTKRPLAANDRR
ncbi:cytochrome b/b6 domain-containing protein [Paracoccus benzoatiresistens]|uniref:Cytochrome b/b6 domain-containing protein n=1 Tax=Paracoccus benzoatiresistens TaxID=2997341 RepID=A0ABT4J9R9_9RHOB|nr:cytochrome b/b6 domain-containing protein [Paracoccus sp. EF6]MCZ0963342.1 cytochrome b/b6 domain-containing protein [Paracoccus sp. EF6]